tara:strand:- start:586 stop:1059 length:474 start_codon:yes stop_codon:yes gene_type:complete
MVSLESQLLPFGKGIDVVRPSEVYVLSVRHMWNPGHYGDEALELLLRETGWGEKPLFVYDLPGDLERDSLEAAGYTVVLGTKLDRETNRRLYAAVQLEKNGMVIDIPVIRLDESDQDNLGMLNVIVGPPPIIGYGLFKETVTDENDRMIRTISTDLL